MTDCLRDCFALHLKRTVQKDLLVTVQNIIISEYIAHSLAITKRKENLLSSSFHKKDLPHKK